MIFIKGIADLVVFADVCYSGSSYISHPGTRDPQFSAFQGLLFLAKGATL